jgi:hypothetical protein
LTPGADPRLVGLEHRRWMPSLAARRRRYRLAVRGVVEDRINTWEVSNTFGDRTHLCEHTINRIVARLRQHYDLAEG